MTGDISDDHNQGGEATSLLWAEARGAAKGRTLHRGTSLVSKRKNPGVGENSVRGDQGLEASSIFQCRIP